jgi:hypothetical protein
MKDEILYNLFLMAFWSDYSFAKHDCVQDEYAYNWNVQSRVFKMLKDLMPEGEATNQWMLYGVGYRQYNYVTESE